MIRVSELYALEDQIIKYEPVSALFLIPDKEYWLKSKPNASRIP